jgi:hypothetical protein
VLARSIFGLVASRTSYYAESRYGAQERRLQSGRVNGSSVDRDHRAHVTVTRIGSLKLRMAVAPAAAAAPESWPLQSQGPKPKAQASRADTELSGTTTWAQAACVPLSAVRSLTAAWEADSVHRSLNRRSMNNREVPGAIG